MPDDRLILATGFVADTPETASEFPSAGADSFLTILGGGEIFPADVARLPSYRTAIDRLWSYAIDTQPRAAAIRTEEHFWSIFHVVHGIDPVVANPFIKRLATFRRFNTVVPGDEKMAAWHMYAEKHVGFRAMFRFLKRHDFDLGIGPDAFRKQAMKQFGVPRGGTAAKVRIAVRRAAILLCARYLHALLLRSGRGTC